GAQVLIMLDRSRSYTAEWGAAKELARQIVGYMDPNRDQVAVASFPAIGGFSESKLNLPFTSNRAQATAALDAVDLPPKDDKTGARICNALAEGLKYFPEGIHDKYRVIVVISGGADKGEGKGDCVQESYAAGKVPFFTVMYKLDKKYDDPRNSHKIENSAHDLSMNTGGRSIFRRSAAENKQFVGLLWNRIRSQYYLQVLFPCYKPEPYIDHISMLKVEGRDTEGLKYNATSRPAPVPEITALYPPSATSSQIDNEEVKLTIDGKGFCGGPGQVKAFVGSVPLNLDSQSPFRLVATLDSRVETASVKVINRFGQSGESPAKFEVMKPPKGAEAGATLIVLVFVFVGLSVVAVLAMVLRRRKAKVPPKPVGAPLPSAAASSPPPPAAAAAPVPRTMALDASPEATAARVAMPDGKLIELAEGDNLIGREPHCKVILEVQGVSREHARIDVQLATGNGVWVEDLGSTNGTHWGPAGAADSAAQKIAERRRLSSGEHIWIGGQKLTVLFPGEAGGGPEA
ncbi:MAG TPA: FHA domain-containing protein, partial [Polyangia bacterium]|nr:FHA domain-containing protein [Polyangia bacterium]